MRTRILISAGIGIASGTFCWFLLRHFHQGAADFSWAIAAARDLLAHRDPYAASMQLYPLPCALFGLPFVGMRPEVAGGIFYGVSSALMAFGLSRYGYHRLLVFMAYPYWAGFLTAQWPPLIFASAFFPLLLPATMAKPQLGVPVFLTNLSRRGFAACALVLLLSLALVPHWPQLWIGHFHNYARFFPVLVLPGPLLLLALWKYRDRDAIFLILMAIMPQRWFYDMLVLWLIPKSRKEIVWTAFLSWGAGLWRWYHIPHSFTEVGRIAILTIYLPMLGVVLLRGWKKPVEILPPTR
ncbi:MAG TPA: hypothetical protein VJQ82_27395 [Terriglobales bacterium]|nr:hypothetical protein [Terriglobales bacterium]